MPEYYLGLMSGTSVDGIDAVLLDLSQPAPALLSARTFAWPDQLRLDVLATAETQRAISLMELGRLDAALGEEFAKAALGIIAQAKLSTDQIAAIGSHGQTLFHAPDTDPAFSMQLGDANRIAEKTGITTVTDFRRRDIVAGGQGAPLVPAFHQAIFQDPDEFRVVLNIGGMANLTLLPPDKRAVAGFDTGPGNVLLDAWCQKHRQTRYDKDGEWARSGELHQPLLDSLLQHPYFRQAPPKSTGREMFCLAWLEKALAQEHARLPAESVQRTLVELTAQTIAISLQQFAADAEQILVCGGGVHNGLLMERLAALTSPCQVGTTENHGLHPDWVEASAFAWLARQTLLGKPGNLPSVTGARCPVVLGAIYPGTPRESDR